MNFFAEFTEQLIYRLEENNRMVKLCLGKLTEEELWQRPNDQSNSVANLILHLCGNLRQYGIASLGNKPDLRERAKEFSTQHTLLKIELWSKLEATVNEAIRTIKNTPEEEWLRAREVQGFTFSGIGVAIHITEHYSYHTGQIALITKLLKNEDLGFYANFDLNIKNSTAPSAPTE